MVPGGRRRGASMNHHPPPVTDELGRYWDQPPRQRVLIDDTNAVMTSQDYARLHVYDLSLPTGTYTGKMWAARGELCWYGDVVGNNIKIERRQVLLLDDGGVDD